MATTDEIPDNVRVITWKGREFWVLEPDEGQVVAITRMAHLQPSQEMSVTRMMAWLNRVPTLVEALLARDDDKDWFEDGYMTKAVQIADLPDFTAEVVKAWWTGSNRQDRRAAKKAPAKKTTARRTA